MVDFEDGQLVERAYIEIDGVKQYVTPAMYSGRTPLSAFVLNKMQKDLKIHTYIMTVTTDISLGAEVTLPFWYKVGNGSLHQIQFENWVLLKAINVDTEGQYYEVGQDNSLSNKIRLASDAEIKAR